MRQRACLLELILADLLGPQTIVRDGLLPAQLVPGPCDAARRWRLRAYSAQLALCPDRIWRVAGDFAPGGGDHPSARLIEGAALACFLPGLCRSLLAETLRLASLPSRWLADKGALQEVAGSRNRWAVAAAFGRGPAHCLEGMTSAQRIALQDRVAAAPWRFAARLLVQGDLISVALARQASGAWAISNGFDQH